MKALPQYTTGTPVETYRGTGTISRYKAGNFHKQDYEVQHRNESRWYAADQIKPRKAA